MNKQTNEIDNNAVAKRAYEIYLERNGQNGDAVSDWLRAESEVRVSATKTDKIEKKATSSKPARTSGSKSPSQSSHR